MNTDAIKEIEYIPGCIVCFNFETPVRGMYVVNELAEMHGGHSHLIVNLADGHVIMSFDSLKTLKNNLNVYDQSVIYPKHNKEESDVHQTR